MSDVPKICELFIDTKNMRKKTFAQNEKKKKNGNT